MLLMMTWEVVTAVKKRERKERSKEDNNITITNIINHRVRGVDIKGLTRVGIPEGVTYTKEGEAGTIRLPPFLNILRVCH